MVDVKFNRPTDALLSTASSGGLPLVAIAGQASLGIMAICALLVLKMFSGAKKKAEMMPATEQLIAGEAAGERLPAGEKDPDSFSLSRKIATSLQNNPEHARKLFTSWLEEDGN